jgi:hypothetical protein
MNKYRIKLRYVSSDDGTPIYDLQRRFCLVFWSTLTIAGLPLLDAKASLKIIQENEKNETNGASNN